MPSQEDHGAMQVEYGGHAIAWHESRLEKPSLKKKNYGKFHNRSDPPFFVFGQNINYFMASKCGLILK